MHIARQPYWCALCKIGSICSSNYVRNVVIWRCLLCVCVTYKTTITSTLDDMVHILQVRPLEIHDSFVQLIHNRLLYLTSSVMIVTVMTMLMIRKNRDNYGETVNRYKTSLWNEFKKQVYLTNTCPLFPLFKVYLGPLIPQHYRLVGPGASAVAWQQCHNLYDQMHPTKRRILQLLPWAVSGVLVAGMAYIVHCYISWHVNGIWHI